MPVSINLPGYLRNFTGGRNTPQIGASPATVRDALAARVFPTKPAPRTAIFVSANLSPGVALGNAAALDSRRQYTPDNRVMRIRLRAVAC